MDNIQVVFEDDYLMVVNKPPGLVIDKSETQSIGTLEDILQKDFGIKLERGGIVHRLDKDTSGLLLIAKTKDALNNLQSQFKNREVRKVYLALVHGLVETSGKVEGDIGRNPGNREKFTVLEGGKEAVTEYQPEGSFQFSSASWRTIFNDLNKIQMRKLERMKYNQFTLLLCKPQTGRTHQIRVHLKHIRHPIVSDEKYVGRKMNRLDNRWCPRLFLHARKLSFYHPKSGEWMEVDSKLPEDLDKSFKLLKS